MTGRLLAAVLAAALTVGGCVDNTAPGNDREADLDAPSPPAEVASVQAALDGVATAMLYPQIIPDADLAAVSVEADACRFRFTRVGYPVLIYGSTAWIKLNGRLVPLPRVALGRWAEAGVEITLRPLETPPQDGSLFRAEMVLRLPGAPNELGFHGFSAC